MLYRTTKLALHCGHSPHVGRRVNENLKYRLDLEKDGDYGKRVEKELGIAAFLHRE